MPMPQKDEQEWGDAIAEALVRIIVILGLFYLLGVAANYPWM